MEFGAEDDIECLVVGANGLVGNYLAGVLSREGIGWKGTFHARPKSGLSRLNILDSNEVSEFFSKDRYRAIFGCANLAGGVDFCQANPQKAEEFHFSATQALGDVCNRMDATFIFLSSDYVFDGAKGEPYREDDMPNPLNRYGKLKLMAEEWIKRNVKKYIIVRTTNVFGWDPETVTPNYIMNLYRTLKAGKPFNAPSYLWGNPTCAGDLAEALVELYSGEAKGVFHVVGKGAVNRYDWAKTACAILGLDASLVKEVKDPPVNMIPRPLRSVLNTDKFTSSYRTILHDIPEGLKLMKSEIAKTVDHLADR